MPHDMDIRPLRIASFCTGIGGLDAGVHHALGGNARTVLYAEGEAYVAAVLVSRMQDGSLDEAPIWSDVKTLDAQPWRDRVDCVLAGFPCQPFSIAGKRGGSSDPKHLWPHIAQHISTIQPAIVFCENVPGLITLGLEQVRDDLQAMGYAVEAGIFSAEECGAPHRRERVFIFAHAQRELGAQQFNTERKDCRQAAVFAGGHGPHGAVADTNSNGQHCSGPIRLQAAASCSAGSGQTEWPGQPGQGAVVRQLGVAADGSSALVDAIARGWPSDWERNVPRVTKDKRHRIDRLRALGNAVVPATASLAWRTLSRQAGLVSA